MRHLAAAEPHGHLDLVALAQELPHGAHLDVVVVDLDAGTHLDLLDVDGLLLLARLVLFLLGFVFEFAVVENLAHGRIALGRDLDQIHSPILGFLDGFIDRHDAQLRAIGIDQTHRCGANVPIDRPVVSHRRLKEWRSCYGYISLIHRRRSRPPHAAGPRVSSRSLSIASPSARFSCSLPPRRRMATWRLSTSLAPTTSMIGVLARLCSRTL